MKLIDAGDLAPDVRAAIGIKPDEVVVEGPGERSHARVVSGPTGALLRRFNAPTTVDAAVLDLSRALGMDPFGLLDDAVPILDELISAGVVVSARSREAGRPNFVIGDEVAGYRLERLLRDLHDTQVFQARAADGQLVAVKVVTTGPTHRVSSPLRHEANMYQLVSGLGVPSILSFGPAAGFDHLATAWIEGVPVSVRANELRAGDDRPALLRLCRDVAAAFGRLHSHGVIHGDVRPSNVLVDREDAVWLIDLGLALVAGHGCDRRSVDYATLEPEAARTLLDGQDIPTPTPAGEQYAVGVLLWGIVTGSNAVPLSPVAAETLKSIVRGPEVSLHAAGIAPWRAVETVLARALAAEPEARFEGLDTLAAALDAIDTPLPPRRPRTLDIEHIVDQTVDRLVDPTLASSCESGVGVHDGTAGAAWFLYRAAMIRAEPDLLAAADLHLVGAGHEGPEPSLPTGILHDRSGSLCIALLLAAAREDSPAAVSRAYALIELLTGRHEVDPELFTGRAGDLAALAAVQQPFERGRCPAPVVRCAAELAADLSILSSALSGDAADRPVPHLGMAHGAAGILYATAVGGGDLGDAWQSAVADLAARAVPIGRGMAWPGTIGHGHEPRTADYAPGWCAGSAGMVQLYAEFEDRVGDQHREVVEAAAWHCYEHPDMTPQLCCGLSGRAIALGHAFRLTGDERWIERAWDLVARAAPSWASGASGLFRGGLGVALAALELERPETAMMPLLGRQPIASALSTPT